MAKKDVKKLKHKLLWLDAKHTLADGNGRVYLAMDQSGAGNHLVQTAPEHAPLKLLNSLNGKPVLNFDGLSRLLHLETSSSLLDASKQHMIYVVARPSETHDGVICTNVEQQGTILRYKIPASGSVCEIRAALPIADAVDTASGGFSVLMVAQEGTSAAAGVLTVSQNGVLGATSSSSLQLAGDTPFAVGRQYSAENNSLIGDIAELIIFEQLHSPAQRLIVENYLQDKYGL